MSEARELTATLNYQYEISCGKIVGVKIGDIKFTWTEGIKPSDKTQVLEASLMKCQPLNIVDMERDELPERFCRVCGLKIKHMTGVDMCACSSPAR